MVESFVTGLSTASSIREVVIFFARPGVLRLTNSTLEM